MQKEQLILLLQRHFSASLSGAEMESLADFIRQPNNKELVIEALAEAGMQVAPTDYDASRFDSILHTILKSDKLSPVIEIEKHRSASNWKRIAVAASILITIGILYFVIPKPDRHPELVSGSKDVPAPSTNRAQITLADGTIVYLDSADNGTLVQQGNIKLVKLDNGQIAYQTASGEIIKEATYNTLSNPRGSKVIDMTLADGSHVWLNAGSSIHYPVSFVGNERKVTITGEAYFEISHDKTKPFIVSANNKADVTVLGTHFNVNAYDDEEELKVTLLEGSVQVSAKLPGLPFSAVKIKPGQQAVLTQNSELRTFTSPDLEQVMAWKNGRFQFKSMALAAIMRQVERWYDVQIVYETDAAAETFTGDVPRKENVSQVLKMLELTNTVHFRIEGSKIIVTK